MVSAYAVEILGGVQFHVRDRVYGGRDFLLVRAS